MVWRFPRHPRAVGPSPARFQPSQSFSEGLAPFTLRGPQSCVTLGGVWGTLHPGLASSYPHLLTVCSPLRLPTPDKARPDRHLECICTEATWGVKISLGW